MAEIVAFDVAPQLIGLYSLTKDSYTSYWRDDRAKIIPRLLEASIVITYGGNDYDLNEIVKLKLIKPRELSKLKSKHVDVRVVCWSDRIWGSNLTDTFRLHFSTLPDLSQTSDPHERSTYLDGYLAAKLWECWKTGTLKVENGNYL